MHDIKMQISDCLLRMFGAVHIEEKFGGKTENDQELRRLLKEMKKLEMEDIRRCYEAAKNDKELMKDPLLALLKGVFEPENDEVEQAKKLLELHGYTVKK